MTDVSIVNEHFAWGRPMFVAFVLIAVFAVVTVVAARKGSAGGLLIGFTVAAAVLGFVFLGYGFVGTRTVVMAPPTVVYAGPAPTVHFPTPAVAPAPMIPAFPPGSGMTPIIEPELMPPAEHAIPAVPAPPVEASRPMENVSVEGAVPDWVKQAHVVENGRSFLVVSGQQFADPAAALNDALTKANTLLMNDFQSASRAFGQWILDPAEAWRIAGREKFTEEIRRSAGENEFTVYRTHLRVEISPQVHDAIEPIWRQQVSTGRSAMAGATLALLTAVAAVLAGYFRLDDRTAGRYRWRLRAGSVATVLLAGATLFGGLAVMPIRSVTAPPIPDPIEAPVAPQAPLPPETYPGPEVAPPGEVYLEPQAGFPFEHPFEVGAYTDCPND